LNASDGFTCRHRVISRYIRYQDPAHTAPPTHFTKRIPPESHDRERAEGAGAHISRFSRVRWQNGWVADIPSTAAWGACDEEKVLEGIIRSLTPAALIVAGAVVFVLCFGFILASDATLASSSPGASGDLAQAGRWLEFVAWLCVLGAVCTAGWEAILRSEWIASAEIAAVSLGTLLLAIGTAAYAASNGSGAAGSVAGAVGIGVWALLVLSRAARVSLTEERQGQPQAPAPARRADLWLVAAIGLFVLAIGYGISSAAGSAGAGIAAGLLEAIGLAALAWSVATARSRKLLDARPVPAVLAGLALLAISFLVAAIVAGLDFGTLTALGIGLTIVAAAEIAGVAAVGLAAWTRVRELYN
jgi:hypothetical protein